MNRRLRRLPLLFTVFAWLCQLWLPVLVRASSVEPVPAAALQWCGGSVATAAALPAELRPAPLPTVEHRCADGCCLPYESVPLPPVRATVLDAAAGSEPPVVVSPPAFPTARSVALARVRGPPPMVWSRL